MYPAAPERKMKNRVANQPVLAGYPRWEILAYCYQDGWRIWPNIAKALAISYGYTEWWEFGMSWLVYSDFALFYNSTTVPFLTFADTSSGYYGKVEFQEGYYIDCGDYMFLETQLKVDRGMGEWEGPFTDDDDYEEPDQERGDAKLDGGVTIHDAIQALRFYHELDTPQGAQYWTSDMEPDGDCDTLDVIAIVEKSQGGGLLLAGDTPINIEFNLSPVWLIEGVYRVVRENGGWGTIETLIALETLVERYDRMTK